MAHDWIVMASAKLWVTVGRMPDFASAANWTGLAVIPSSETATMSRVVFVTAHHHGAARP
jgi:hypothetical protein